MTDEKPVRIGILELYPNARRVQNGHDGVDLGGYEYLLFCALADMPFTPVAKGALARELFNSDSREAIRSVEQAANRLRRKLRRIHVDAVIVDWGRGYKLFPSVPDWGAGS